MFNKNRFEWILLGVLIIFYGWLLIDTSQSSKRETLTLVEDLPAIALKDSIQFDQNWFSRKYKVVAFFKGDIPPLALDWDKYIEKYPDIGFIFYMIHMKEQEVIDALEEHQFYHPVILDIDGAFEKANSPILTDYTFSSYIVNGRNEVITASNPSLGEDFDKRLYILSHR